MDTNQGIMTASANSQIIEDTINRFVDSYSDSVTMVNRETEDTINRFVDDVTISNREAQITTISDTAVRYDPSNETITYSGYPINGDWWTRSSTIATTERYNNDFEGFSNILEKCKKYLKEKLKDVSYDIIGLNLKDFSAESDKSRIIDIALEIPSSDVLISYISVIVNKDGDILPYEKDLRQDEAEDEGD